MSEDRALEVLGLSTVTSEQELKRAYLRQVKAHPPERDADRFREVREAYELLKQGAWVRRLVAAAPSERLAELVAQAPLAAPTTEAAPVVAPSAEAAPDVVTAEAAPGVVAEPPVVVEMPDEADETGPSFPPHVAKEIDALNQALAGDDPVGAAGAMVALYGRPLLEEVPVPPPLFALKTFMVLMEREHFRQARSLLEAFEQHVQRHQDGTATGTDVAARWKLAREVLATQELDEDLASAVARGLRNGQLYTAGDAAEAAFHAHGSKLERHMKAKAPTVWGSIAPLIRSPRREVASSGSGFKLGRGGPIWVAAIVGFNILRLLASTGSPSSTPTVYTEPPRIEDYRPRPTAVDSSVLNVGPPEVEAALERQLNGSWAALEQAVNIGDCQTVGEQWPLYQAAKGTNSHVDRKVEASRVARVLEMCPELKEILEPTP